MNKKWLVSMAGAAALAFSAGAMAQFYVGAEVGQTDIDGASDDIGLKFLGGYQFHPNVAAEVGFGMMYDKGTH